MLRCYCFASGSDFTIRDNFLMFWQGNPILGVHIYLFSDDVVEVDCPQVDDHVIPPVQRKALCHTVSDADGKFMFKSIPCGTAFVLSCDISHSWSLLPVPSLSSMLIQRHGPANV